jgi:Ca-activated chloride channel homolog
MLAAALSAAAPAQRSNPQRSHRPSSRAARAGPAQLRPPSSPRSGCQTAAQTDVNRPSSRLGVNEVNLIFTVTDKHGHYIPNLQQSDFALLDDQKAPAR